MTNKYRFSAAMQPGWYAVFDRATMTRVPGLVHRTENGQITYRRERPAKRKGARHIVDTFTTETVAAMSQRLDEYFTTEQQETSQ